MLAPLALIIFVCMSCNPSGTFKGDAPLGIWVDGNGAYLHLQTGPNPAVPAFAEAETTFVRGSLRGIQNPLPEDYGVFPDDLDAEIRLEDDTLVIDDVPFTQEPTWPEHETLLGEMGRTDWASQPLISSGSPGDAYYKGAVASGFVAINGLGGHDFAAGIPPVPGIAFYGSGGKITRFVPSEVVGNPYDLVVHPDGAFTTVTLSGLVSHVAADGETAAWSWPGLTDARIYGGIVADGESTFLLAQSYSTGWHLIGLAGDGTVELDQVIAGGDVQLTGLVAADGGLALAAWGPATALLAGEALGADGLTTVLALDKQGQPRWRRGLGPDPGAPVALYPAPTGLLVDVNLGTDLDVGNYTMAGDGNDRGIVRLDADGVVSWAYAINDITYGSPLSFAVLPDGRVVGASAGFSGTAGQTWLLVWDAAGSSVDDLLIAADCACTYYPGSGAFLPYQALATDDGGLLLLGGGGNANLDLGALSYPQEELGYYGLLSPMQAALIRIDAGG